MGAAVMLPLINAGAISVGTAAALPALGSVIGAVSAVSSALGSINQGKSQAASARYNAQVQENNAQIAKNNATLAGQEGAANAGIQQQKTRATVGAIKAAQAANGVDVNSGSALDVRSSAAELGQLSAITIRSNAAKSAYAYQTGASSNEAQAQLDRQEAKNDIKAADITAGTSLLGKAASGSQSGLWGDYLQSGSL